MLDFSDLLVIGNVRRFRGAHIACRVAESINYRAFHESLKMYDMPKSNQAPFFQQSDKDQ
jgi:hypothetical protein